MFVDASFWFITFQNVVLHDNQQEREHFDNMAEVYSLLLATEQLEKAYMRDCVTHQEYTTNCTKFISQFKTCVNTLGSEFSVRDFVSKYNLHCPAAIHRLVEVGVPATIEHTSRPASSDTIAKHVAETVQVCLNSYF